MSERLHRTAVPVEQTWDLDSLFPSTAAWEEALAKVDALVPELTGFQGRLGAGPRELLACLRKQDELDMLASQVLWFAYNRQNEDQTDPVRQGLKDRATAMSARVATATSFIKPEVLSLPEGTVRQYLDAEPELRLYALLLTDILEEMAHMLGPEGEAVIAQMTELFEAPYDTFNSVTNADATFASVVDEKGQTVAVNLSSIHRLLQSPDRSVREAAYRSVRAGLAAHKRTLASTFATAQKRDVIVARLRKYPSALAAALGPVHLPESLFHTLLQVSQAGSGHFRRFLEYRRKKLGVDQLKPWDLAVPLDAGTNPDITFRDAYGMIFDAMAPLGREYRSVLERSYRERWVDWADNVGKEKGAYNWGCYGYHPVILLNWQGKLSDAFTLAHELGHAVHSVMSNAKQPYVYHGYSNFLAEMASTTNELLLARHLLKTTSEPGLRRFILTRAISAFTSNFWGGSMMAKLQLQVHEMVEQGTPLTWESITAANTAVNKAWYGDTLEITEEGMGSQWAQVLHHYLNFYSYQYATGISAGAAFSDAILTEGEPAVKRYLGFLSAGSSKHPMEILKEAGIDMTTPAPLERAVAVFAGLVDELERT